MSSASANKKGDVVQPTAVVATPVTATIAQPPLEVEATAANDIGTCRRCRQQFVRRPGVHDGEAQYYRCEECEKFRLQDIIEGSCTIL